MIILHFDLQLQFKYMNYFIYTSHRNRLLQEKQTLRYFETFFWWYLSETIIVGNYFQKWNLTGSKKKLKVAFWLYNFVCRELKSTVRVYNEFQWFLRKPGCLPIPTWIFIFIEESSLWINLQKKLDTYLELPKEETVNVPPSRCLINVIN